MYANPNSLYGTARRKQWPSETKSLQGNEDAYLPQYTGLSFSKTNECHDELYHQAPIDVNLPYQFKLPHYRHLHQMEPPFLPKRVIRLPSLVPATTQNSPRPVATTEAKIDHEDRVENTQLEDPFAAVMLDGGDEGMCPKRPAERRPFFENIPTEYSSSSDGQTVGLTFVPIEDTSEGSDGVSIGITMVSREKLDAQEYSSGSEVVEICGPSYTGGDEELPPSSTSTRNDASKQQTVAKRRQCSDSTISSKNRQQTFLKKYGAFKHSQYKRCSVRICAVINQSSASKSMIKGERRTVRKACFRECQVFKGKAKDLEIENRVIQSLRDDGSLDKFLNRPLAKNGGKKQASEQSTGASMGSPQEKPISVNRSPRSPRSLEDPWVELTQEEEKSEKNDGK